MPMVLDFTKTCKANMQGLVERCYRISHDYISLSSTLITKPQTRQSFLLTAPAQRTSKHSTSTIKSTILHLVCKEFSLRPTVLHLLCKGQLFFPAFYILTLQKPDLRPVTEERLRVDRTNRLRSPLFSLSRFACSQRRRWQRSVLVRRNFRSILRQRPVVASAGL